MEIEAQLAKDPIVPTESGDYVVYPSLRTAKGITPYPILADFGKATFDDASNTDWIMPDQYRAPEVLLGAPWEFGVDIWSFGIMVRSNFLKSFADVLIVVLTDFGIDRRQKSIRTN